MTRNRRRGNGFGDKRRVYQGDPGISGDELECLPNGELRIGQGIALVTTSLTFLKITSNSSSGFHTCGTSCSSCRKSSSNDARKLVKRAESAGSLILPRSVVQACQCIVLRAGTFSFSAVGRYEGEGFSKVVRSR